MSFIVINTNRTVVDAPVSTDLLTDMANDINLLNTTQTSSADASGVPTILNGSFEADPSGTGGSPQAWTFLSNGGPTGQTTNSNQAHGGQSYAITANGSTNGSGQLYTGLMNCSPLNIFEVIFMMMNNTAGISNNILLIWFYANKTPIGSSLSIYNNNNQVPNLWQAFNYMVTPPAGAYYFSLQAYCAQGTPPACTVYLDGFSTRPYQGFDFLTQFNGSGTFICPPGCFKVKVRVFGWGNGGSQRGGYSEGVMTTGIFPGATINIGIGEPCSAWNAFYNFGAHNNPAIPGSSDGGTFGNAPIQINSFSTVLKDGNVNAMNAGVVILEW